MQDLQLAPTSLWRNEGVEWWATPPFEASAASCPARLPAACPGRRVLPRSASRRRLRLANVHACAVCLQVPEGAHDLSFCFTDGHGCWVSWTAGQAWQRGVGIEL